MDATLDENGRAELSLIDDSPDWDDYNRYLDLQVLVAPW